MPGGLIVGSLRAVLGLDSAQFDSGIQKARGNLKNFGVQAAAGFAAAAAAAAAAFVQIRSAADRADDMWKASQSIGIPIKDLGRLAYAAEMSGAEFATLSTGVRKASQNIQQAAAGATGEASKAFKALGVDVKNSDGSLRTAGDVIADVADRFSRMPDGVTKTSAAMAIFGKSGAALIPTLNMGRDGLQQMGDEAERMGLVFDERTARASEQFNDNLMRLSLTMTGLWNKVLAGVIPAFSALSDRFVTASQEGGALDQIARGISVAMNILAKAVGWVFDNMSLLWTLLKVFVAAKTAVFVASVARSFVGWALTIVKTGKALAIVNGVLKGNITLVLLLAAALLEATGQTKNFAGWLSSAYTQLKSALPTEVQQGIDGLTNSIEGLWNELSGFETSGVQNMLAGSIDGAASAAATFGDMGDAATSAGTAAGGALTDGLNKATDAASSLADRTSETFKGIGSSIAGLIKGTKSLGDALMDIGAMFLNQVNWGSSPIGGLFSGLFGGLFGGGTGLATGGRMMQAGIVDVGERGRERVMLPRGAQVIRHNDIGGIGNQVTIHQSISLAGAMSPNDVGMIAKSIADRSAAEIRKKLPGWEVARSREGK